MFPQVITTAGPLWESELVERARATGTLRIAERAFHPAQVHKDLAEGRARTVLVGAETPWLSPGLVGAWRRMGAVVIGKNDPYHPPSCRLLEERGCHFVVEEPDPEWTAAALGVALSVTPVPVAPTGPKVVAMGGPRGAPGRTEGALGLGSCPGWPLPAGGSRYLSRSGAAAGTPLAASNPPAGHCGRDRPVAVGPPGIGGWNPAQRLVAVLRLPDGGGGPRAGTPSLREMARRASGGMPSQSFGD